MNFNKMKKIYKKLLAKRFKPMHVAEVGVYKPETSNVYDYIMQGVKTTLVEPDLDSISKIKEHFSGMDNVTLHPVAAYDFNGDLELTQRLASTYVTELKSSPAIINDGYTPSANDVFVVKAVTFDKIDDGSIDFLSIDVEGSEWFVIKYMLSRPAVISVETHGALYTNPYMSKIEGWMKSNDYKLWYKDKSDSVYIKTGSINISVEDKINLTIMSVYLKIRKIKKKITRFVKSKRKLPG